MSNDQTTKIEAMQRTIDGLSQTLWWLLVQSDGEVKIPLHTKMASAPVGRIEWHDEDPSGTTVVSIAP